MNSIECALSRREPVLCDVSSLLAYAARVARGAQLPELPKPGAAAPGEDGRTAVVEVRGVIGRGLGPVAQLFGATDVDSLRDELIAAQDNGAERIVLYVNSPGGTVSGVPELAAYIRRLDVPTMAYTDRLCCSAAYWLASQCDEMIAAPSAEVANVGCFQVFIDAHEAAQREGVSVEVFRSGEYKAAGVPGTSLTDAQRAEIQARVDDVGARFRTDVLAVRRFAESADLNGQTFFGWDAATRGLVTGLADTLADALSA